ncbi:unnamed protein product [Haemonchus placei]|uniref:Ovule protein n=1 Tax=Haemonchus placei TaxID=6290 RepID=A0A0N4WE71_HAEPC|nr:unnamed protein product [Haemonchus placei]
MMSKMCRLTFRHGRYFFSIDWKNPMNWRRVFESSCVLFILYWKVSASISRSKSWNVLLALFCQKKRSSELV